MSPPVVKARFLGGSLGGQEHEITYENPYRVPVLVRRPHAVDHGSLQSPVVRQYAADEYRVEARAGDIFIYRWVRPDIEGLQEQIRQLQAEVARLTPPPEPRRGLMRFTHDRDDWDDD